MVDMGDKGWLERLDHRQKPITDGYYGLTGLGGRGYHRILSIGGMIPDLYSSERFWAH